ncbi:MAG: (2Fe-2S)-binding protein [Bacillus sp. (in: firmicutes)]
MERRWIKLKVNGKERQVYIKPNELLLNVLRNELGLMGTKYGCGIGECGACTVLVNGQAMLSCMILAVTMEGQEITTVEGLGDYDRLHPLQRSFLDQGAVQCGFCTSGMLITAKALLDENPCPTEEDIRQYLRGNLCRCTGYTAIVKAVQEAAKVMQANES